MLLTGSCGCGKTVGLLMAGLLDVDRPGHRALLVQRTLAGPVSQDSGASGKSVISDYRRILAGHAPSGRGLGLSTDAGTAIVSVTAGRAQVTLEYWSGFVYTGPATTRPSSRSRSGPPRSGSRRTGRSEKAARAAAAAWPSAYQSRKS